MKLRPGNPEAVGMSAQRVRRIADLAAGWVAEGITPALVVLVARKGVVVLHEAFGRLGPEPDAPPLERDTIFPVASITKPITATAVMLLVEEGLLGLNRPVRWYLPEFTGEGKDAVMVHHLLTHTSGLRNEEVEAHAEGKGEPVEVPPPDETQHPLVHEYLLPRYDAPLWKPPGVEMSYCSYGYALLGEIVRRVSGSSLAGYCRERIFEPLGMADSYYIVPDSVQHRIVGRAADTPLAIPLEAWKVAETPWASAGAYSTALDIAVFGQIFLNGGAYGDGRVLSPASVREMTRNQIPGISARLGDEFFPEASWGFGWNTRAGKQCIGYAETLQSQEAFSHGGMGGTFVWVDPAHQIVGVYFSVASPRGVPGHVRLEGFFADGEMMGRVDLLINAATAAIVDV